MEPSQKSPFRQSLFVILGVCLLIGVIGTTTYLNTKLPAKSATITNPSPFLENIQSLQNSLTSDDIADHIASSSGLNANNFTYYSTSLAQTLSQLTEKERNEVIRGVAIPKKRISTSQ